MCGADVFDGTECGSEREADSAASHAACWFIDEHVIIDELAAVFT